MVFSCVAANCTNKANLKDGISIHTIPYVNDDRPEAEKRRKIWIDLILWRPNVSSNLQSPHVYVRLISNRRISKDAFTCMLPGQTRPNFQNFRTDKVGKCVFPSIHAEPKPRRVINETLSTSTSPSTSAGDRSRRMVSYFLLIFLRIFAQFLF